jgi:hypothetical protein
MVPLLPAVKESLFGAERLVTMLGCGTEAALEAELANARYSNALLHRSYVDKFSELQESFGWPKDVDACDYLVCLAKQYRGISYHQLHFAALRDMACKSSAGGSGVGGMAPPTAEDKGKGEGKGRPGSSVGAPVGASDSASERAGGGGGSPSGSCGPKDGSQACWYATAMA